MRTRKKKHGTERILACDEYFVHNPEDIAKKPVWLEIGCGKGAFIAETAKRNPDISFVAVEKISDVIVVAAERIKREEIGNVRFLICDAKMLNEFFEKGDVSGIYLNFSDPWPKAGHAKRRLTHRNYLAVYKSILADGGEIRFKTDNRGLFDFSLEEFEASGFTLSHVTNDLHNSPDNEGNVETEYEKNFSAKGFSINRCIATLDTVKES